MCGRYALYGVAQLPRRLAVAQPAGLPLEDRYNVAPGQYMPVVIGTPEGRLLQRMKWGLIPSWAKEEKIGYKLINARAEGIFDKPAWRHAVRHSRCLVPARGFYEWQQRSTGKQPYFIRPKNHGFFVFAGLWESWTGPEGESLLSYAIVTTDANHDMQPIHDRMPAILSAEAAALWLADAVDDRALLAELLRPYADGKLECFPVSRKVNTVRNDERQLVYPINSQ